MKAMATAYTTAPKSSAPEKPRKVIRIPPVTGPMARVRDEVEASRAIAWAVRPGPATVSNKVRRAGMSVAQ
jgi:hypothetical protein